MPATVFESPFAITSTGAAILSPAWVFTAAGITTGAPGFLTFATMSGFKWSPWMSVMSTRSAGLAFEKSPCAGST